MLDLIAANEEEMLPQLEDEIKVMLIQAIQMTKVIFAGGGDEAAMPMGALLRKPWLEDRVCQLSF